MLLKGQCIGCGCDITLDIGDMTVEQVKEKLRNKQDFSCPGHHVELCSPYPAFWKVDDWKLVEGSAPTDEEFLANLKKQYTEVVDTDEMNRRKIITGFSYGFPMTNDGNTWNFTMAPSGKRFYYRT